MIRKDNKRCGKNDIKTRINMLDKQLPGEEGVAVTSSKRSITVSDAL